MATVPTAEESARKILEVFKQNNSPAGYVLSTFLLKIGFVDGGGTGDDFKEGLKHGLIVGWFDMTTLSQVSLTDMGFKEM